MPPNGQAIAALIALGILRHIDVAALPVDSVASQHLQIEAMKIAFADTHAHVADPKRAQAFETGHVRRGGTIYPTAADECGMMVSFIQSNCMGFGSGVVVPQWRLSLHNRGHFFSLDPAGANCVAPGRRPSTRSSRASSRKVARP